MTRLYPQFVGNIQTITPSRANATLEFTAPDRVEQLRTVLLRARGSPRLLEWLVALTHYRLPGPEI
jgi:hypothetical protein